MDRLPQKLIYVIDDDEDDFQILRDTILTKWPTVALEHFPDPEVFLITREFRKCPDLVVLDINMPKINGFEVIKALKNDESWTQVPVIFLSTSITLNPHCS